MEDPGVQITFGRRGRNIDDALQNVAIQRDLGFQLPQSARAVLGERGIVLGLD
jgi:hypothetical protein